MIAALVLPPLMAGGWAVGKAAVERWQPKQVILHRPNFVDWQKAVEEVRAMEAMRNSHAPVPSPPNK